MRNAMADAIRDARDRWQRRADALEHVPHDLAWRGLAQNMNVAHRRAQHSS